MTASCADATDREELTLLNLVKEDWNANKHL